MSKTYNTLNAPKALDPLEGTQALGALQKSPQRILMIKSHSMGVGDVLRSSAAWRALKDRFGPVELHLLFLSKHPGYATESLIKEHHLLSSAHFLTLRPTSPDEQQVQTTSMHALVAQSLQICVDLEIDLIIDFEMHGLRGAWLTWRLQRELSREHQSVQTLGVAQFWIKRFFYDLCSKSLKAFALDQGLALPMDYSNRDFVVLSALGIQRQGRSIELQSSPQAQQSVQRMLDEFQKRRRRSAQEKSRFLLALNIGCGTPDALYKRPQMADLVSAMLALYCVRPFDLLLTGAAFEQDVNQAFIQAFEQALNQAFEVAHQSSGSPPSGSASVSGSALNCLDCAGQTSLPELSALIGECDLMVSTDSGPYHMAVALKVPTLAWFIKEEKASYHQVAWCKHVVHPSADEFVELSLSLLKPLA
ncbi:MAG: glycosyltransferase family 9 protein [Betaproteobacteria bacterium]